MTRLLVLALVLCLMVPMIVACQDNTQKPVGNNNNNNNNNNNGSSVFDIYNVEDGLPESANYDDIFTILYYNATGVPEFFVEDDTGGVIDGAVFAFCFA